MKKGKVISQYFILLFFLICLWTGGRMEVQAESSYEEMLRDNLRAEYEDEENYIEMEIYFNSFDSFKPYILTRESSSFEVDMWCRCENDKPLTFKVTSSDTNVVKIKEKSQNITIECNRWLDNYNFRVDYEICNSGVATITLESELVTCSINIVNPPEYQKVTSIVQQNFTKSKITWNKVEHCSGYMVKRTEKYMDKGETIATVSNKNTTSAIIPTEIGKKYYYYICPYVQMGDIVIEEADLQESLQKYREDGDEFTGQSFMYFFKAEKTGAAIQKVRIKDSSHLEIKWNKIANAKYYKLYMATSDNGKGTCIFTTKNNEKTSYIHKVVKGKTYFYYIVTVYSYGKSDPAEPVAGILPKKGSAASKIQEAIEQESYEGQYGHYASYCAQPDRTFYYEKKGKHYIVCVQPDNKSLNIYCLDSKMKMKNKKTVSVGKYDHWGGFYHGIDGKFYVAIGYNNPKESDKKTVIKVQQYNSNWKLLKTCSIKGNATNAFKGIYIPFDAGNCRMDMQGNLLYIATAREMYDIEGIHHQSNIEFAIDVRTMKYKDTQDTYSSHSFNQFIKFKGGSLYQIDHGDAYPRTIKMTVIDNYGNDEETTKTLDLFEILGETGANFTGVKVGGMEVGSKNVMVCGTSQPQNYKIKNVSGNGDGLGYNVFLVVAKRDGNKSTVKWLTKYNPANSDVEVGETRMVKLSDDKFAILYNTTKANKTTLNYLVVNNNGKKIFNKKYSNLTFNADSQPIIYNGYIQWTTSYYDKNYRKVTKTVRIPVKF